MLVEWIDHAATVLPIDNLSDLQVLLLCDSALDADLQQELSDLLADNREGVLDTKSQQRLDDLMQLYRRGLVHKAEAIKVAVKRGLRSPLN